MTSPDFTQIPLATHFTPQTLADWQAQLERETGRQAADFVWETLEQIDVQPLYTAENAADAAQFGYAAGLPPYLRGPYPAMYAVRPWTIRQYAGFSTAERV